MLHEMLEQLTSDAGEQDGSSQEPDGVSWREGLNPSAVGTCLQSFAQFKTFFFCASFIFYVTLVLV